jgi:hypothetical protein
MRVITEAPDSRASKKKRGQGEKGKTEEVPQVGFDGCLR